MPLEGGLRHRLHTSARRTLGDDEGDALMELLPPRWEDFATKNDLETGLALVEQRMLTALHHEISTAIAAQTKTFIWANVGMVVALASVFLTTAFILH